MGAVQESQTTSDTPSHSPEKLIPVVILKVVSGEPIPPSGAGGSLRHGLYEEDHEDPLLLAVPPQAA